MEAAMADANDNAVRERGDMAARERALDITQSFLVQAPAGSGKTGLLIQRFLALLAHVDRPERIVAMTFTRKAATEMRERVLKALRDAEDEITVDTSRSNDVAVRRLALAALAQDRRRDWQVLAQPSRLRMLTIDALAASLARQAPVTTGLGALPTFIDDATPLYLQAVRSSLAVAVPNDPAWRCFLSRVDNDADRAVVLLASLLARRDQWLRLPFGAKRADLRGQLERALRAEIDSALARTRAMFSAPIAARLAESQRYAATQFAQSGGMEAAANALLLAADQGGVPRADADDLPLWQTLADFLLTRSSTEPTIRQQVDARNGFPAKGKEPGCADRVAAKRAMTELLADVRDVPGLPDSLHAARTLPAPVYGDAAWDFVEATLALLPQIAGHLLTVFASNGAADFGEATLRALAALGDADDPGQLLLAVDYRLDPSARRRVPGYVVDPPRTDCNAHLRLGAGRRPHDLRRRRSDAVDLPVSRGRSRHFPGRTGEIARCRRFRRVSRS